VSEVGDRLTVTRLKPSRATALILVALLAGRETFGLSLEH